MKCDYCCRQIHAGDEKTLLKFVYHPFCLQTFAQWLKERGYEFEELASELESV